MKTKKSLELTVLIFTVFRLMKQQMSFSDDLIHLSILQTQALIFLNQNGNKKISMSDMAEYFHIELPSATSLVNKLVDQQFISRHADPSDRRLVLITLTDVGKDMLGQAMNQRRTRVEKMLSYLSEQEKVQLHNILSSLVTKLQE
jgi:DNA-binding MarR family transcriptional regulator